VPVRLVGERAGAILELAANSIRAVGQRAEERYGILAEQPPERGQQQAPGARPCPGRAAIRPVANGIDRRGAGAQVGAALVEGRADPGQAVDHGPRPGRSEPSETGAAQQVEEHRFRPVVGRVGRRERDTAVFAGECRERSVAGPARLGLSRAVHPDPRADQIQAEPLRGLPDAGPLGARRAVPAETMVDVGKQGAVNLQRGGQAHRIGATGEGEEDATLDRERVHSPKLTQLGAAENDDCPLRA